jgi:hypothetical protein
MTHSKWYEIARRNFKSGRWSEEMLANVRDKGRITNAEYDLIVSGNAEDPVEES